MKTLYRGGKIITMEQDFTAEALLTDGGRIAAVGSEERLAALGAQRVVNLVGGALLPGFLDAHSHFSQVSAAQGRRRWVAAGTWRRPSATFSGAPLPPPGTGSSPGTTIPRRGRPLPVWRRWTP